MFLYIIAQNILGALLHFALLVKILISITAGQYELNRNQITD